jgi:hypothetical protein
MRFKIELEIFVDNKEEGDLIDAVKAFCLMLCYKVLGLKVTKYD